MLWTPRTTTEMVFAEIVQDLFDRPVMSSAARTVFARHLVLAALGDGFRRGTVSDLERVDGRAIAVRQAAALDADPCAALRPASFAVDDLAADDGAEVLILAWHGNAVRATADQRDPAQWSFAVLPTAQLPRSRTLDWSAVEQSTPIVAFAALRDEARRVMTLPPRETPAFAHATN